MDALSSKFFPFKSDAMMFQYCFNHLLVSQLRTGVGNVARSGTEPKALRHEVGNTGSAQERGSNGRDSVSNPRQYGSAICAGIGRFQPHSSVRLVRPAVWPAHSNCSRHVVTGALLR